MNFRSGIYNFLIFLPFIVNAQTHVQTTTLFNSPSGTTISRVFAAASGNNNLLIAHFSWDNQTRVITAVADSKGNLWQKIQGPTNWHTNYRSELWYSYSIIGGGPAITISATLNAAPTSYFQIYISEFSNMATVNPLDQKRVSIGNAAAVSSGNVTTLATNELIYGVAIGASGALAVGAGFTSRSVANQNIVESKNVVAKAAYNAGFTSAGGNWVAEIATFKSSTSLPIELIDFTAECVSNKAELKWSTATEKDNDYFAVEKSAEGENYSEIARIAGAGNSAIKRSYSYTDADPNNETVYYYRLKQNDFDGNYKYSPVAVLDCKEIEMESSFYPNPVQRELIVKIKTNAEQYVSIFIKDVLGRPVYSSTELISEGNAHLSIDVSGFENGMYLIEIKSKSGSLNGKFSK